MVIIAGNWIIVHRIRRVLIKCSVNVVSSMGLEDISGEKSVKKRIDMRGKRIMGQRARNMNRQMPCRSDIDQFNVPFQAVFESLIPAEEEKAKQNQLFTVLENLVNRECPETRLYLYGSCVNSFGLSKSDIDVCLGMELGNLDKSEILLKLADILQSDNRQNVQALTRARVPIVKLMDPVTGILCDICVNNVMAVVNTKLLRDYAQIDRMEIKYFATVDDVECAYFDQVEKLHNYGSRNGESIAQLVWGFFHYWAYCHDYGKDVISVRTGCTLNKKAKDWTRRVGSDRHLICIEDPFELSHDLGRVVNKFTIKILRGEFERAAYIMQHDPNPCVTLFEPCIPD